MEKYNLNKPCPKCGCSNVSSKYNGGEGIERLTDFIERDCVRCGHSWDEEPLDKR